MNNHQTSAAWDFSPVLQLVNALTYTHTESASIQHNDDSSIRHPQRGTDEHSTSHKSSSAGLGDFVKIWQYLGVPDASTNKQQVPLTSETSAGDTFASKHDYASDGAVRYGSRTRERKKVTWREDTSIDDAAPGSSPERHTESDRNGHKLTKSQRKKKNRRERRAKEAGNNAWTVSESEADNVVLHTPARKASVHGMPLETAAHHDLRLRDNIADGNAPNNIMPKRAVHGLRQASQPELPTMKNEETGVSDKAAPTVQWPVVPKTKVPVNGFLPSTVSPKPASRHPDKCRDSIFPIDTLDAVRAVQQAQAQLQSTTPTKNLRNRMPMIEPKIVRSGEDRHWALLLKLINEFQQDRKYLVSPMNMTTHNNDPTGLHLFVDASNIFIGFNEQLKRSRNIPLTARVPLVDLSFDALALLMERRRPIAKRTLVGSTPRLPAFDKAEAVGYECSILEKVYKARELTERQIYFRERDGVGKPRSGRDSNQDGGGYSSGGGYTSESGAAGKQYAPARLIEQGVDELLHMKMAQSLLDYDVPATMVVATGDAAQAEYSDGFKAMIERALRKGWAVELVSWSKNISSLYLRRDFQSMWGDRFKVIYLDDYAEELLDM